MAVIDHKTVNNTENYNSYIVTRVMVLTSNGISSCKGKSWTVWKWFRGGIKILVTGTTERATKCYLWLITTCYTWPVTCDPLLVACYMCTTRGSLPVFRYHSLITCDPSPWLMTYYCDTLPVTHCLWPIASNPLPTTLYLEINGPIPVTHDQSTITVTHESLPLTCYQKPISWDLLPVSLYAWPITCDPLSVTR